MSRHVKHSEVGSIYNTYEAFSLPSFVLISVAFQTYPVWKSWVVCGGTVPSWVVQGVDSQIRTSQGTSISFLTVMLNALPIVIILAMSQRKEGHRGLQLQRLGEIRYELYRKRGATRLWGKVRADIIVRDVRTI